MSAPAADDAAAAVHHNNNHHHHPDGHESSPDSNASPVPDKNEKRVDEINDDVHADDLELSQPEYKHIIKKLDWAIIPYCSLLYLLSFLDRVNIGQAAVAGKLPLLQDKIIAFLIL
jgi:hypothetical protein